MSQGLVQFLYLLLRDHLTAGTVEALVVEHVEKTAGLEVQYSSPHLEALAREFAERIEGRDRNLRSE